MLNKIFYVYQYVDNLGIPYYIGKGKGKRIHEKHYKTIVPVMECRQFIQIEMTEMEALDLENTLIRQYGRKIDGGTLDNTKLNQWICLAGWNHSAATKKKISDSTMGKLKSEETKQKMRKPKSAEHAEKIRQANVGRKDDGRAEKSAEKNRLLRWFNNGEIAKMFKPGNEAHGFQPGRISSKKNKGEVF